MLCMLYVQRLDFIPLTEIARRSDAFVTQHRFEDLQRDFFTSLERRLVTKNSKNGCTSQDSYLALS